MSQIEISVQESHYLSIYLCCSSPRCSPVSIVNINIIIGVQIGECVPEPHRLYCDAKKQNI